MILISVNIHESPILPHYFRYSKPQQGADPARHGWSCPSVATRAASKDLRTVSLVSTSVRVQLHGLRTSGSFGVVRMWVCLKMLCSPKPNGFADHYPYEMAISLGIHPTFSDKPM